MKDELPLIECVWIDAARSDEEMAINEAARKRPVKVIDVGWLLHEDAEAIVLTHALCEEFQNARGWIAIPKCWIVKRRRLK